MQIRTFEELKKMAIAIDHPIGVIKSAGRKGILLPGVDPSLEKGYEIHFSIIAFVSNGIKYVIPYMRDVMELLKENGFSRKTIPVPFYWESPTEEAVRSKWDELKVLAKT